MSEYFYLCEDSAGTFMSTSTCSDSYSRTVSKNYLKFTVRVYDGSTLSCETDYKYIYPSSTTQEYTVDYSFTCNTNGKYLALYFPDMGIEFKSVDPVTKDSYGGKVHLYAKYTSFEGNDITTLYYGGSYPSNVEAIPEPVNVSAKYGELYSSLTYSITMVGPITVSEKYGTLYSELTYKKSKDLAEKYGQLFSSLTYSITQTGPVQVSEKYGTLQSSITLDSISFHVNRKYGELYSSITYKIAKNLRRKYGKLYSSITYSLSQTPAVEISKKYGTLYSSITYTLAKDINIKYGLLKSWIDYSLTQTSAIELTYKYGQLYSSITYTLSQKAPVSLASKYGTLQSTTEYIISKGVSEKYGTLYSSIIYGLTFKNAVEISEKYGTLQSWIDYTLATGVSRKYGLLYSSISYSLARYLSAKYGLLKSWLDYSISLKEAVSLSDKFGLLESWIGYTITTTGPTEISSKFGILESWIDYTVSTGVLAKYGTLYSSLTYSLSVEGPIEISEKYGLLQSWIDYKISSGVLKKYGTLYSSLTYSISFTEAREISAKYGTLYSSLEYVLSLGYKYGLLYSWITYTITTKPPVELSEKYGTLYSSLTYEISFPQEGYKYGLLYSSLHYVISFPKPVNTIDLIRDPVSLEKFKLTIHSKEAVIVAHEQFIRDRIEEPEKPIAVFFGGKMLFLGRIWKVERVVGTGFARYTIKDILSADPDFTVVFRHDGGDLAQNLAVFLANYYPTIEIGTYASATANKMGCECSLRSLIRNLWFFYDLHILYDYDIDTKIPKMYVDYRGLTSISLPSEFTLIERKDVQRSCSQLYVAQVGLRDGVAEVFRVKYDSSDSTSVDGWTIERVGICFDRNCKYGVQWLGHDSELRHVNILETGETDLGAKYALIELLYYTEHLPGFTPDKDSCPNIALDDLRNTTTEVNARVYKTLRITTTQDGFDCDGNTRPYLWISYDVEPSQLIDDRTSLVGFTKACIVDYDTIQEYQSYQDMLRGAYRLFRKGETYILTIPVSKFYQMTDNFSKLVGATIMPFSILGEDKVDFKITEITYEKGIIRMIVSNTGSTSYLTYAKELFSGIA